VYDAAHPRARARPEKLQREVRKPRRVDTKR
jgi:hypothetical protein